MVLARPSPRASASAPKPGDRILIFKPQWLMQILARTKTMEVRGCPYKGKFYFGTKGERFKRTIRNTYSTHEV